MCCLWEIKRQSQDKGRVPNGKVVVALERLRRVSALQRRPAPLPRFVHGPAAWGINAFLRRWPLRRGGDWSVIVRIALAKLR